MTDVSDDELRARLSRLDPAPAGSPVDPVTSPLAQELVERAMRTPESMPTPGTHAPGNSAAASAEPTDELTARPQRPWLIPLAAAVLVIATVGAVLALSGGGRVGDAPGGEDPTTLALDLPPSDVAGSCLVFDVQALAEMPVAFGGTVTATEGRQVTLDVDRWYRGGDADVVTVAVADGQTSAALDGVDFRQGERYLVTATDGTVNGCGYSGPAEPQLEQAFEQAFVG